MPPTRDVGIDEIFRSRPNDFVRTRNIVAARLRKAGRTADAADIARLRKPSPSLWAVNQLAHEHAQDVDAFFLSVDQLRRAQLGRRRDGINQAASRQRNALENLMTLARGILRAAGLTPAPAVLGRISATLLGAAADKDVRQRLRRGQLMAEHGAPGFEAYAGMKWAARQERSDPKGADARREPVAAAQSRQQQRTAEREAWAATAAAEKLRRQASRLLRRTEKTARTVERRREQLRKAEQQLAQERQAAETAAKAAAESELRAMRMKRAEA